jgi:hypothetical protein
LPYKITCNKEFLGSCDKLLAPMISGKQIEQKQGQKKGWRAIPCGIT